ncbi:hypothetical protein F4808DRAFT_64266 [Astrocystis sublimbata]|nr:hypothetical protein F4808DRAFT_446431 [Astrocystis sublimbata]KAI0188077.1 hypothetical protein F4808DRAFT_64266 [Astrocystis sublimbata]
MAPGTLSRALTQFFPPKALFTEKNLGDLSNKIYVVTGATSGLGRELSRLLYSKNAKVYMSGRSEERGNEAIQYIKAAVPRSSGSLVFFHLDLDDLASVKKSAERFLAAEKRLHVLFSNAGFQGPEGPVVRTSQGFERHLQVNCLGTLLFFKLLAPTLVATAQDLTTAPNTVRAIFMSSFAAELFGERETGFAMDNLDYHVEKPSKYCYGISKLGDWAYAIEIAKRYPSIVSLALNPGNLRTDLFRDQSSLFKIMTHPLNYPAINGAYTQLWAGLSPDVSLNKSGSYVAPFGRFYSMRSDLDAATVPESEGGNGSTQKFWDWSMEQLRQFE